MIPDQFTQTICTGCVLVGIGNPLRGDDGFGPWVIQQLQGRTRLPLIDAAMAPENWSGPLERLNPTAIVLLDALSLDAPVGSLHWLNPEDAAAGGVSTHTQSLGLLVAFIKQSIPAEVHLLGVTAGHVALARCMSDEVRATAEMLVAFVCRFAPCNPRG